MSEHNIFRSITIPEAHWGLRINRFAEWYSWSVPFRRCVRNLKDWLLSFPEPKLIHIQGLADYDYTFALPAPVPKDLRPFLRSLCSMKRPRKIMLFADLLDTELDSAILCRLFAVMRGCMVDVLGDERFCLYAPLGQTGKKAGDFALHADLYLPEILFNIFEDVPADGTGASIFLAVSDLRKLLVSVKKVRPSVRRGILECFDSALTQDHFDKLFDLLHGPGGPWVAELEREMRRNQLSIRLSPGQGYMIHDRTWLHGRESPSGGVSRKRIHRLIFNTLSMQKRLPGKVRT